MLTFQTESRQVRRKRERDQKKIARAMEKQEYQIIIKIRCLLGNVISEQRINEIAKRTEFQQRKREIYPLAIVSILMIGCFNGFANIPIIPLERMCALLWKWFNVSVKPQSLQEMINRKGTSNLIKEVMMLVMTNEVDKLVSRLLKNHRMNINLFCRILIQDSTVISLPDTLKKIFKGCGGSASEAAIKCDFIIDQNNRRLVRIKCVPGIIPDANLSADILDFVQKDDLIVRDLGYFNLSHFSRIIAKKAYFISRLSKSVYIYLNKDDQVPFDIMEHLKKLKVGDKDIDIQVYLGQNERIPIRLIGLKVPPEVVEARRQQYKRSNGRSKEPSESLCEWNGYTLMITNIQKDQLSLKSILKLYKIRWQIELYFKNMKSNMLADELTGTNKYRILCFIYIRLAVTWIISTLYAYAQARAKEGEEVSLSKFTRWLRDVAEFKGACITCNFSSLLEEIDRDVDLLLVKKRKTSWKDVEASYEQDNRVKNRKAA